MEFSTMPAQVPEERPEGEQHEDDEDSDSGDEDSLGGNEGEQGAFKMSGSSRRGRHAWTAEEDNLLQALVAAYGDTTRSWSTIAGKLGGTRTGKQCRERWFNRTMPGTKRGAWSPHEEYMICKEHARIGSHWSIIAKKLPGRNDNSIKNHFNAAMRSKAEYNKKSSMLWLYVRFLRAGKAPKDALQLAQEDWELHAPPQTAMEVLGRAPAGMRPEQLQLQGLHPTAQQQLQMLLQQQEQLRLEQQLAAAAAAAQQQQQQEQEAYLMQQQQQQLAQLAAASGLPANLAGALGSSSLMPGADSNAVLAALASLTGQSPSMGLPQMSLSNAAALLGSLGMDAAGAAAAGVAGGAASGSGLGAGLPGMQRNGSEAGAAGVPRGSTGAPLPADGTRSDAAAAAAAAAAVAAAAGGAGASAAGHGTGDAAPHAGGGSPVSAAATAAAAAAAAAAVEMANAPGPIVKMEEPSGDHVHARAHARAHGHGHHYGDHSSSGYPQEHVGHHMGLDMSATHAINHHQQHQHQQHQHHQHLQQQRQHQHHLQQHPSGNTGLTLPPAPALQLGVQGGGHLAGAPMGKPGDGSASGNQLLSSLLGSNGGHSHLQGPQQSHGQHQHQQAAQQHGGQGQQLLAPLLNNSAAAAAAQSLLMQANNHLSCLNSSQLPMLPVGGNNLQLPMQLAGSNQTQLQVPIVTPDGLVVNMLLPLQ